eukprot:1597637-Pyramimonas_sp.AAC.1
MSGSSGGRPKDSRSRDMENGSSSTASAMACCLLLMVYFWMWTAAFFLDAERLQELLLWYADLRLGHGCSPTAGP